MASLLGAGRSMLARVRAAELVNANYVSSAGTTAVTALQAETKFESDTGDIIIDSRAVDWIVQASQLLAFPVQGDEIVISGRTYQVVAIGMEPAARWHDRDGSTLRIHTIEVA